MSVTDEIKARLDITSYIAQYVPLKKSGKYHKACCPFHSENTPSFVVDEERQFWRCYGACAEGGDIFSFAQKYHGWDFKEALQELGKLAGVEVRQQSPEQKQRAERNDRLRGLLKEAASAYHRKLYDRRDTTALDYARDKRGLSNETIQAFGIGYAPPGWGNLLGYLTKLGYSEDDIIAAGLALRSERTGSAYDRFRNRFVVPIRDGRGRVVGFGGRVLDPDDSPKYLNSPQSDIFDKSHLLFGLDLAKDAIRETETAVIVEGYMDVITAHQAGFTNVVAQMGTALTDTQLGLIAPRWAKRVVLALDSDAAGQNATRRSLDVAREALRADYSGRMSVDVRVLQIPGAKDPDDLIREEPERWASLVDNAMSVADYLIEMEMAALPDDPSIQEREAVARRLMPLLNATENNLYRHENVQKLAVRLHIAERDLMQLAHEQAQRERPPRRPPPPFDDEPPPRDDFGEPPPEMMPDDMPPPDRAVEPIAPVMSEARTEAHLLNRLLECPDAYYRVNGKLREVAGGSDDLMRGPLAPLGEQDFTRTGLRAVMTLFLDALEQDAYDVTTYVAVNVDDALREDVSLVAENWLVAKLQDPTAVSPRDLDRVDQRIQRAGTLIDEQSDLLALSLRVRCRRLTRERDELKLMQQHATAERDHERASYYADEIDRLARATHLLQVEEAKISRPY